MNINIYLRCVLFVFVIFIVISCSQERDTWNRIRDTDKLYELEDFLEAYPKSEYRDSAEMLIDSMVFSYVNSIRTIDGVSYYLQNRSSTKYKKEAFQLVSQLKKNPNSELSDVDKVYLKINYDFPADNVFKIERAQFEKILNESFIEISNDRDSSDLEIIININGKALSEKYLPDGNVNYAFSSYSGAIISGEILALRNNDKVFAIPFYYENRPPSYIEYVNESPQDAPFEETFDSLNFCQKIESVISIIQHKQSIMDKIHDTEIIDLVYNAENIFAITKNSKLFALNNKNGKIIWHKEVPCNEYDNNIEILALHDNQIILANYKSDDPSGRKKLYSISSCRTSNGAILWENKNPGEFDIIKTRHSKEFLYILATSDIFSSNKLITINSQSGLIVKNKYLGDRYDDLVISDSLCFFTSYLSDDPKSTNKNFSFNSDFCVFDLKKDSVLWDKETSSSNFYRFTLPRGQGHLILALTYDGDLSAISLADGKPIWKSDQKVHHINNFTQCDSSIAVIMVGGGNWLSCINIYNGQEIWKTKSPYIRGHAINTIKVANNTIYISGDNLIAALSKTDGELLWKTNINNHGILDVSDNYVFIDCFHTLLLLDAKNGYITRKSTVASYCAEDVFLLNNDDIIFSNNRSRPYMNFVWKN